MEKKTVRVIVGVFFLAFFSIFSSKSWAIFIDGDGHYSLRGETETNPGFSKKRGTFQAINQYFSLTGEAKVNDKLSFKMEFQLFDNPRAAYLGDTASPREDTRPNCPPKPIVPPDNQDYRVDESSCSDHQNTGEPGYKPYIPKVTKAYAVYAFDYCLLEAGRRGRDWGLGIFMSSGKGPFDTDASVYDGVTCNINIQKSQTLGFSFGYDKLAETGAYTGNGSEPPKDQFGATRKGDDLDQYFFVIGYDDRKANAGANFTKQIGIYFANVMGSESKTDLKFMDLYTNFYFYDFTFRNELLLRLGKSGDPSWYSMGGAPLDEDERPKQDVQSIGFAGDFTWTIYRTGSIVGPPEFRQGNASSHSAFFEYAYAPGDNDGYYNKDIIDKFNKDIYDKRNKKVTAMAFHRNYKPAMIFFNGHPETDDLRVDGVFDPSRVMDTLLYTTGYRFESLSIGSIQVKFITAKLLTTIQPEVKNYYFILEKERRDEIESLRQQKKDASAVENKKIIRPIGFSDNNLGYELDVNYRYFVGKEIDFGLGAAGAIPQKTWQTLEGDSPIFDYLLQTDVAFHF